MDSVERDIHTLNTRDNDQSEEIRGLQDRMMLQENALRAALGRLAALEQNMQAVVAGQYGSGPTAEG